MLDCIHSATRTYLMYLCTTKIVYFGLGKCRSSDRSSIRCDCEDQKYRAMYIQSSNKLISMLMVHGPRGIQNSRAGFKAKQIILSHWPCSDDVRRENEAWKKYYDSSDLLPVESGCFCDAQDDRRMSHVAKTDRSVTDRLTGEEWYQHSLHQS